MDIIFILLDCFFVLCLCGLSYLCYYCDQENTTLQRELAANKATLERCRKQLNAANKLALTRQCKATHDRQIAEQLLHEAEQLCRKYDKRLLAAEIE